MIWTLLTKDLLRRWRNPGGIIILILIPLLATLMLGSIFGPGKEKNIKPRISLLVEDHDNSMASQFLLGAFSRGEMAQLFQVENITAGTGRQRMDKGDASALLIIPAGFGDSLLAQKPSTLTLVKNPSQAFAPKIAEETIMVLAEAGDRLVHIASEPISQIHASMQQSAVMPESQIGEISIGFSRLITKGKGYLSPPLIKVVSDTTATGGSNTMTSSILFAYLLAGMSMMMLLFTLDTLARDIFRERENRTWFRIMTTPVTANTYVSAKLLFILLTGLISQILLWAVGAAVFSIPVTQPLFFLLFLTLCTATLTGVIALVYALARTRTQASAILPAVIIVFSMLGGAMVPLNALPAALRSAAQFSPVYWCIDGLQNILIEAATPVKLTTHFTVLILLTLGLNSLAFFFFARKARS